MRRSPSQHFLIEWVTTVVTHYYKENKQIKSLEELIQFLKTCPIEYEITSFQQGKAVVKFWIGSNE